MVELQFETPDLKQSSSSDTVEVAYARSRNEARRLLIHLQSAGIAAESQMSLVEAMGDGLAITVKRSDLVLASELLVDHQHRCQNEGEDDVPYDEDDSGEDDDFDNDDDYDDFDDDDDYEDEDYEEDDEF